MLNDRLGHFRIKQSFLGRRRTASGGDDDIRGRAAPVLRHAVDPKGWRRGREVDGAFYRLAVTDRRSVI